MEQDSTTEFIRWFRQSSPYINAHRGKTFVVFLSGDVVASSDFPSVVHDLTLLSSLGVRLVLVHGARAQVEQKLQTLSIESQIVNDIRITDETTLPHVVEAVSAIRCTIEALFTTGLSNSPMAGADVRIVSGNMVTAKPLGVRNGVDYCHSGTVRRIDIAAIKQHLSNEHLVLLSPIGYSVTGEMFSLNALQLAASTAISLQADKLIILLPDVNVLGTHQEQTQLTAKQIREILKQDQLDHDSQQVLSHALLACEQGISRVHLLDNQTDGSILKELFTRDGVGLLVSEGHYDSVRKASIEDVGGILELIEPLEQNGTLVRRSRELLEIEIEQFFVMERDGTIIACAALYPYEDQQVGELACMAVHHDYQGQGRGDDLLFLVEQAAIELNLKQLFVLTALTAHWFLERGFEAAQIADLPLQKQQLYNFQRKSKVFIKPLDQKQKRPMVSR